MRLHQLAVLVVAATAACDRAPQALPFDATSEAATVRTIPQEGGALSSAAGASIGLPAGAVAAGTQVTLTPTASPTQSASGVAAAPYAFHLTPAGQVLAHPADAELRVDRRRADAWLASIVVTTPSGVHEEGETGVDVSAGIARGKIGALGTLAAVIPGPDAVLRAEPLLDGASASRSPAPVASLVTAPTRAIRGDCGGPARRCTGLRVRVSDSFLRMVDSAAVVFPRVAGEITISGASAKGSLTLIAPLRVRLASGAIAVSVPSRISAHATAQTVVTETAGRIALSNMRVVGKSGGQESEVLMTLVVEHDGSRASMELEQRFESTVVQGDRKTVTLAARVPLVRVQ